MKKIIVLEDSQYCLESLVDTLKQAGHEVIGVSTPREFEKVMKVDQFDIFMIDHDLGPMQITGSSFCEQHRLPKEKCLGISSVFPQTYCLRQFKNKVDLGSVNPERSESSRKKLFQLISDWPN